LVVLEKTLVLITDLSKQERMTDGALNDLLFPLLTVIKAVTEKSAVIVGLFKKAVCNCKV
jgi:hypothetical protein